MILPNVVAYDVRPSNLRSNKAISITELPVKTRIDTADRNVIDRIRCQSNTNDITTNSESPFKDDIEQMMELKGAYCQSAPVSKIVGVIQNIHDTLDDKKVPETKSWIRNLTNLHPEVNRKIKNMGYWKTPYSEQMGTNTVLYYPYDTSVDISNKGKKPLISNKVQDISYIVPQYVRETTRHKLDVQVLDYVQNASHLTTKYQTRNLIFDAELSTAACGCGGEQYVTRPIPITVPEINSGASLNYDWYHGTYRVAKVKSDCKSDIESELNKINKVSKLVNHLNPLVNSAGAQSVNARFEDPLGVEETFPNRPGGLTVDVNNSGQKVVSSPTQVNNDALKPEIT